MADSKKKPGNPKEHHSIKIDGELWRDLQELAELDNRAKNNLIETVLKEYRDKNKHLLKKKEA